MSFWVSSDRGNRCPSGSVVIGVTDVLLDQFDRGNRCPSGSVVIGVTTVNSVIESVLTEMVISRDKVLLSHYR